MLKKGKRLFLAAALGLSMIFTMPAGTLAQDAEEAATVDYLQDVAYVEDGNKDHLLDVFGTEGVTETTKTVIEVHGGGYIGGSKNTNTDHSRYYSDNGFLVVTPNYTHVRKDGPDFKAAIQDLFLAYNWVADHAEEYHFDLDNIFLSGDSAGGFYVLITAAILQSEELQQYFEVTPPAFDFSGYVATCPGTDIKGMRDDLGAEGPAGYTADSIGEEILNNEELINHLDLYSVIDSETYPYIYMLTTPNDNVTGPEMKNFMQFLDENGIAYECHTYEDQENELGHVFNVTHTDWAESIQANNDIIEYMNGLCK